MLAFDGERGFAVLAFTVVDDHAVAIDVFIDPELVAKLDIRGITAWEMQPRELRALPTPSEHE